MAPKGGVTEPIQDCTVAIIPKCTGLIPAAVAMGRIMGTRMRITGTQSTNMQAMKKNRLVIKRITNADGLLPITESVSIAGRLA